MNPKLRRFSIVASWIARGLATIAAINVSLFWISQPHSELVALGGAVLLVTALVWGVWFYEYVLHRPRGAGPSGKRLCSLFFVLTVLAGGSVSSSGCGKLIAPGEVGIKVNYYGSQRGVEDFPLVTGMVWYNPLTTTVFDYPVFMQTAIWTKSLHEGAKVNEEISFNSKEGLVFTADISLSYRLSAEKIPHFYVQFRSDNLTHFTHTFLRNVARDHFNEVAVKYTAEDIYGERKEQYLSEVKGRINGQMAPYGVIIEQFGFIGAPRPPDSVSDAINAKIKAIQDAIRVENEVRQAKAEAQKAVAKAEGEARANQILAASLTTPLIEWRRLELTDRAIAKWNGQRPAVEGAGSGLLLNISPTDVKR